MPMDAYTLTCLFFHHPFDVIVPSSCDLKLLPYTIGINKALTESDPNTYRGVYDFTKEVSFVGFEEFYVNPVLIVGISEAIGHNLFAYQLRVDQNTLPHKVIGTALQRCYKLACDLEGMDLSKQDPVEIAQFMRESGFNAELFNVSKGYLEEGALEKIAKFTIVEKVLQPHEEEYDDVYDF